jgi:hypothetical protein
MATADETWRARRRDARLTALRQLPPGAAVSEPGDPEAALLLHGLMALSDEADPSAWLMAEHPALTVRAALRAELGYLSDMVVGLGRAQAAGVGSGVAGADAAGRLAAAGQVAGLLNNLASREGLAASIAALRGDKELERDVLSWARGQHQLLADLLGGPASADPLAWIAEHRPGLAADLVLTELVGQVTDDLGMDVGRIRQVLYPMREVAARELSVTLRRVDVGTDGTLLTMSVTGPVPVMRTISLPTEVQGRTVTDVYWQGFEEMRDDRGHYYVMARYEEYGSEPDRGGLRTTLARESFFPAIAGDRVMLSSLGYRLDTMDMTGAPGQIDAVLVSAPLHLEFSVGT